MIERIGALAGRDLAVEPLSEGGVLRERRAAVLDDVVDGMEPRVVVIAQPARLVVDHLFELRQPVRDRQYLVDLLLIFHRRKAHLGVREHIGEFVRDRIGIDRHRHGAERLRGHHRPIKPRPVRADDRDGVAAL